MPCSLLPRGARRDTRPPPNKNRGSELKKLLSFRGISRATIVFRISRPLDGTMISRSRYLYLSPLPPFPQIAENPRLTDAARFNLSEEASDLVETDSAYASLHRALN